MDVDALVIGAGYGGLGAAVTLARAGRTVQVHEALTYPGGCAGTFTKHGRRYEAGATLASGLGRGQLLRTWLDDAGVPVQAQLLDPAIVVRTPQMVLPVDADKQAFVARLCALPGAPADGIRRFFALQTAVADTFWPLFDDPARTLPVRTGLGFNLGRIGGYARFARWLGRPMRAVLRHCGVADFAPLRTALDALCQITVQCPANEAEALIALSAIDYGFRGAVHVHGGMGALADGLCEVVRHHGGAVRFADRVKSLVPEAGGWRVTTRSGSILARQVFANLLPGDLASLANLDGHRGLARRQAAVTQGWGAAMGYGWLEGDGFAAPTHLELVRDPTAPLPDGNHVFVSIGAAQEGGRPVTMSTHLTMGPNPAERAARVQAAMQDTVAACAPELAEVTWMTASPRTFARFTRRGGGWVGGIPRRAGLGGLMDVGVVQPAPGLFLVGDSVFPGQSALGAAVGGARTALWAS